MISLLLSGALLFGLKAERPVVGVNYLSLYHRYTTPESVLRRDFSRFRRDGISVVSLSLHWQRLEGDKEGDFSGKFSMKGRRGELYGDPFLEQVRRVIRVADDCGLKVLVTFHTLWNEAWCTPNYVVDPVTGRVQTLAILRSEGMQDAFVKAVEHAVAKLAGEEGIWAWAVLNEPWYWPKKLPPPFERVDQRGMAIKLVRRLSEIVKGLDGRPVTVRFVNFHIWRRKDGGWGWKNIFVDDWGWDERLFSALDFVGLNAYMPKPEELRPAWRKVLTENVLGIRRRFAKEVLITEFGWPSDDDAEQARAYEEMLSVYKSLPLMGWLAWAWNSEKETGGGCLRPGMGFNLCKDFEGRPRRAYFVLVGRER